MNNMIRQYKRALLLLTLFSLPCAAFSKVPEVPQDKPNWSIGVTAPSFYPIYVSQAYGVNEQENWTSILFSYNRLLHTISLSNAQNWVPDYDGFGIALHPLVDVAPAQMGGTNHLPDSIYVYWTSMYDLKFYVTKFDLSDKVKALMLKKKSYKYQGSDIPCYINDFVLGLLPNGHAKVWLYGCNYIYVEELAPFKIMQQDYEGRTVERLQNVGTQQVAVKAQKQAETLGNTVFPIPWDKVNKVYTKDGDMVESIDDYNDQGDLIHPRPEPIAPKLEPVTYRCWADKPPEPNTPLKLDPSSPQFTFLQLLWEYSPQLVNPVDNLDSTINDAWKEAKQQGLDEDHTQAWVLARLVGLSDYPLDKLYKELKVSAQGQQLIKQYVDQMCQ